MKLRAAAASDVGQQRRVNEDCHAVALDVRPDATSIVTKCPDIRHIPGTSYEHHPPLSG